MNSVATRERYTDAEIIDALQRARGIREVAARYLECSRSVIDRRCKTVDLVREVAEEEREKVVDVAEDRLFNAVAKGESWAIQFLLKTQGKKRGYIERQEQDVRTKTEVAIYLPERRAVVDAVVTELGSGE